MSGLYGPPLKHPVNPSNLICAFDLHRVLFHRDWKAIILYVLRMPHKLKFILIGLNPFFWLNVWRIWKITSVGDDIYDRLVEIYPQLRHFKNDFIALENMQRPDSEMLELVRSLKASGYTLYILSNIGQRAFTDLAIKHPNFLHLFDHVYLPQKSNNYLQKPAGKFYEDFLSFVANKHDDDKSILFIDDRLANVESAANNGISGLLFDSYKNLEVRLKQFSIMPPEK